MHTVMQGQTEAHLKESFHLNNKILNNTNKYNLHDEETDLMLPEDDSAY